MSHTDAHTPNSVRVDRREVAVQAAHAYFHPFCDLPSVGDPIVGSNCYWQVAFTGSNFCSCSLCYGSGDRLRRVRAERRKFAQRMSSSIRYWNGGEDLEEALQV
ncbi:hypothetical protein [Rhodococcus sp. NPDC006774]|uniref:hypothetical protein n=1 Tax=Rhodococcus sp. NPDC006774 TaxID=3157186 RepID=UPI0033E736E5